MADNRLKEVAVRDGYKQCAFPMRPNAKAMSDCCQQHALTVVEHPDGSFTWRCYEHEGMVDSSTTGPAKWTYLTREDIDPRLVRRYIDEESVVKG